MFGSAIIGAVTDDEEQPPDAPPSMAELIGGPIGLVESSAPGVAFVIAYLVSGSDTRTSVIVAVALAVLMAIVRVVRRESPRQTVSGLFGVAIAAFIATKSGKAENFFLPGLLLNLAYGAAFLVSAVIRRPLVGYIVGQLDGEGTGWREDPVRMRAFTRASYLWSGLFGVRLLVQLPLYLAGAVVALGVAKTAMGIPLFALGLWLTYRLVQRHRPGAPAAPGPAAEA
jgi:hypothetical protein